MYVCVYVCVRVGAQVCMYEGQATSGACTATITDLVCFPFRLTLYQSRTSNELHGLTYGGVIIVALLHQNLVQGR
jgi:hypothetical protein